MQLISGIIFFIEFFAIEFYDFLSHGLKKDFIRSSIGKEFLMIIIFKAVQFI